MVQLRPLDQLWLKAWPAVTVEVPLEFLELYCNDIAGGLAQTIYDKLGNEGLELIKKVMYEAGRRVAERHKLAGKVKATDLKSVGEFYVSLFNNWLGSVLIPESTDKKVVHRVVACEFGCADKKLCDAMMALDRGIVETLNPELTVVTVKTVSAGEPYCENVVRKR
jgi:predicted hydrocarbon binding protein